MTVRVVGFKDKIPCSAFVVNTTSRSDNWSKGLSPFLLGPVSLYDVHIALNVENAWQFSKVYSEFTDQDKNPSDKYWEWAKKGWSDSFAHRYPLGKGKTPLYSLWDGKKLNYIEARKEIYIPLYSKAVRNTRAYSQLEECYQEYSELYLLDFDGYNKDKLNMSYQDVIESSSRKMGHAFVLAMMLTGIL